MQLNTRLTTLALALLTFTGAARAETLVYVTPSAYGTLDTAASNIDTTPGGPVSYTLPSGYQPISAAISSDNASQLYILGRSGGTCQLFVATPPSASFSASLGAYACDSQAGQAAFIGGTGGNGQLEYVVADQSQIIDINPDSGGSSRVLAIAPATGKPTPAVAAFVSLPPPSAGADHPFYVIDGAAASFAALNTDNNPPEETSLVALPLDTATPANSLAYSVAAGTFYMLAGKSSLYAVKGVPTASGNFSLVGGTPAPALAVLANFGGSFGGGSSSSSSSGGSSSSSSSSSGGSSSSSSSSSGGNGNGSGDSGGGAFAPLLALPLFGLGLLRRRRAGR